MEYFFTNYMIVIQLKQSGKNGSVISNLLMLNLISINHTQHQFYSKKSIVYLQNKFFLVYNLS